MLDLTNDDLRLVRHQILEPEMKLEIFDKDDNYITTIQGNIIDGSSSISESDVRRTFSISILPCEKSRLYLGQNGLIWVDKIVRIYIGLYDQRKKDYRWWKHGKYVFTDASATYDATNNTLSVNCSDMMSMLDGTKNGLLGQLVIQIPAYEEDEETGEVIKYNTIRDAMIKTVTQLGRVKDYEIDHIGEFYALPENNVDYLEYREESKVQIKDGSYFETWASIPYDLEFSSGCSVLSMLIGLRDLYPNYQIYFDENGTFCCNLIPSLYEDDVVLKNDFIKKILISESSSVDLTTIRNIVEVWGEVIEADFYASEGVTLTDSIYTATIEGYEEKYYNGDVIALHIPSTNPENAQVNINGFGAISIYNENTEEPIEKEILEADQTYAFKVKKKHVDGVDVARLYLLGQWQPHAISVLTDGTVGDEYTTTSGKTVKRYSKEYFQEIYNCKTVELVIIPDSPFTVQKLGEILQPYSGGEFANITSDSLALARSGYELWKLSRLTDSISITTLLCPFLDINIKVSYKPYSLDLHDEYQYIVKSITHDFINGTTSWNLIKFYPLYQDSSITDAETWNNLSQYTWADIQSYTWSQIANK